MKIVNRILWLLLSAQLGYHLGPHYIQHPLNVFSYVFIAIILAIMLLCLSVDDDEELEGLQGPIVTAGVVLNLLTFIFLGLAGV